MRINRLFLTLALTLLVGAAQAFGQGQTIYDATLNPLPPNMVSLGYQATSTAEFGDYITLGGSRRRAGTATVTMSNWALNSTYPTMSASGFNHPITLSIYAVDHSAIDPAVGALLGRKTQTFLIPWRPAADPTCPGGTAWRASNGSCYNGLAVNITFDLKSLNLTLPDDVIFGIAYNTNTWGYSPIHQPGPYESLNVALATAAATVGLDADTDGVFWNTQAGFYTDGGLGGSGTFRRDTLWTGFSAAIKFTSAVPATSDECKNNGWKTLTRENGTTFKNQGDCVSYVQNGK